MMNIAVIDDEHDICDVLTYEIESMGHTASVFHSAQEAMPFLRDSMPDLVICDFQMPKMNGLELFLWMKEQKLFIPFLIFTGEPEMDPRELLALGITQVLFKPRDVTHIRSSINTFCSNHQN